MSGDGSSRWSWSERPRSVGLVDAQYLRAAIDKIAGLPINTFDMLDFANRITPRFHWRFRTYYFDAPPYKPVNTASPEQTRRYELKKAELKAIGRLDRFTVREGYCQHTWKWGRAATRPKTSEKFGLVEQKMVDVLLATEMTRVAWSAEARHVCLVAGDSDYVAAVRAAKDAGALVRLYYLRDGNTTFGDRLYDEVDERFDLRPVLEAMRDGRPDHRRAHEHAPSAPDAQAAALDESDTDAEGSTTE